VKEIAAVLAAESGSDAERSEARLYCCPKCTSKLYECVSAHVFRYIDSKKWKTEIENAL
jgi:hypothetical protein